MTELEAAIEAAKRGGAILQKYWGRLQNIESKGYAWDLVTEADKESEKAILSHLSQTFPSHTLLSEEAGLIEAEKSDYVWIIDPLDGTTNYTHQFPFVAISVGLQIKEELTLGVIYNPILNELFVAEKGKGATLNGKPIAVSKVDTIEYSLLVTGFAYNRRETTDNNYPEFCHLTQISQGVRRVGAAAIDLAYIAAGRLDGYWEQGLQQWDMAAGALLVTEAGGKVTNYDGSPFDLSSGKILATNGVIHSSLIREIEQARNG